MIKYALIGIAVFAIAGFVFGYLSADHAMKKCQELHSFDVCFQMMNK